MIDKERLSQLKECADSHCIQCGSCCHDTKYVEVTKKELQRIAKHLKKSTPSLRKKHVIRKVGKLGDQGFHISQPCPFLTEEKRCRVYEARPSICRGFPIDYYFSVFEQGKDTGGLLGCTAFEETLKIMTLLLPHIL